MTDSPEPRPTITADAHAGQLDDPTKNVLNALDDAVQRQDDLRKAQAELFAAELTGLKEWINAKLEALTHEFALVESRRQEQKIDTKCVEASTPILCADLIWRPAGDLKVGDELITVDDLPQCEKGSRTPRSFRRGVVTANSLERDDLLRVSTAKGDVLCNANHPFLTLRPQPSGRTRYWNWIRAADLMSGDLLMRAVDVWEVEGSWEGGWLAGIFDGEGCLMTDPDPRLVVTQRESETADRIERALRDRVDTCRKVVKPWTKARRTLTADYCVTHRADVMRLLGSVRPHRLLFNADRVWEGRSIGGKRRATPLLGVEAAGSGTIAMLSVSTGTYIAGGFASHNTAVDAALSAAEKAVREQAAASEKSITKSETAALEQSKQNAQTSAAALKGVTDTLADVKDRVVKIESEALGRHDSRADNRSSVGMVAAIAGGLFGFVMMVVAIVSVIYAIAKH